LKTLRGKAQAQADFLTIPDLNATVPPHHPLRTVNRQVDANLENSPLFEGLCDPGRPGIPPDETGGVVAARNRRAQRLRPSPAIARWKAPCICQDGRDGVFTLPGNTHPPPVVMPAWLGA
jgi:hypothetical protein